MLSSTYSTVVESNLDAGLASTFHKPRWAFSTSRKKTIAKGVFFAQLVDKRPSTSGAPLYIYFTKGEQYSMDNGIVG